MVVGARLDLRVLGCHGGTTDHHKTCSFLLGAELALDAGALGSALTLADQDELRVVLVSHAHLDHVAELAFVVDNRCQRGCPPLTVAGTPGTLAALRRHFFNDVLWPDFTRIPSAKEPTIEYLELPFGEVVRVAGHDVEAIPVSHTIESAAFLVRRRLGGARGPAFAYSGDTGPTKALFDRLEREPELAALLMEVSFPNRMRTLATVSGHHTPETMAVDLDQLSRARDLPTFAYHLKPTFEREMERELAALKRDRLELLRLGLEL